MTGGVFLVGLTGGIGAGKSTVAALLAERGPTVIDSDLLAREAVEPGSDGLAAVVASFGLGVLTVEGSLDRKALAAKVFDNPGALARLNAVVHPRVAELTRRRLAGLAPGTIVVHDIPLLVETGAAGRYALVVVVEASRAVRLARLAGRGMSAEEADARIRAQAGEDERRAVADVVIDNSGGYDDLAAQVTALWARIVDETTG